MSMIGRFPLRRLALALALALPAAGCGPERGDISAAALAGAQGLLARAQGGGEAQPSLRSQLTPAALAQIGQPLLYAAIPSRRAEAALLVAGRNAGHVTWATQDGITLSFRDGVLNATRGLGDDLMSADLEDVIPAIRAGAGQAVRIHRYLDGENQLYVKSFVCSYAGAGGAVTERCTNPELSFENRYRIGPGGLMHSSRQWVSPSIGHVSTERLIR